MSAPVQRPADPMYDLAILGAGPAGIEAALFAAEAGYRVALIERNPRMGGKLTVFQTLAPSLETAPGLAGSKLSALASLPGIALLAETELLEASGRMGNFGLRLRQRARRVDTAKCIGCGLCTEACPVEKSSDRDLGLGKEKAIALPFPGAIPSGALIDAAACVRLRGQSCEACRQACPAGAIELDSEDAEFLIRARAIILAVGYEFHDPLRPVAFGRPGPPKERYRLAQFERLAAWDGPSGGRILKSDGAPPASIAFLHCAGKPELGYCSSVCCMAALKAGLMAKESLKDAAIYHLVYDLRTPCPAGAKLRRRAEEKGLRIIPLSLEKAVKAEDLEGSCRLLFRGEDRQDHELKTDMLVFVSGIAPARGAKKLASLFEIDLDDRGFIAADHPILRPFQATRPGIFLAGCAGGPKNLPESLLSGRAAAGAATALVRTLTGAKIPRASAPAGA